jgi:hypothetical protein
MSRGIGATQRAILDQLAQHDNGCTVGALADAIGRSDRQIRRAVTNLEQRHLVLVRRKCLGHRGIGEYGRARRKDGKHADVPTAYAITKGRHAGTEFYWSGMPSSGLVVTLCPPEQAERLAECIAIAEAERDAERLAGVGWIDHTRQRVSGAYSRTIAGHHTTEVRTTWPTTRPTAPPR